MNYLIHHIILTAFVYIGLRWHDKEMENMEKRTEKVLRELEKELDLIVDRNLGGTHFMKFWDKLGEKYGRGILKRELRELFSHHLSLAYQAGVEEGRKEKNEKDI